jgi:hypothetical protein
VQEMLGHASSEITHIDLDLAKRVQRQMVQETSLRVALAIFSCSSVKISALLGAS